MAITVHIYPNKKRLQQIPDGTEAALASNTSQLSSEAFKAALDRLAAKAIEFDGPNAQPLSDYAMSRESIYENHPKL